jgi:Tfp pilus assembly protein PilO
MRSPNNIALLLWWIGLTVVGGGLMIWPNASDISGLRREASRLEDRVRRDDDGEAELRRLESRLEEVRAEAERRLRVIPAESGVADLIRQLSGLLSTLSIEEREITTGAATRAEHASLMPMSVSLTCGFLSVYDVVRWVESLPRLVRVQRLRVTSADREPGTGGPVEAEILLDVFYAPAPSGVASAGTEGAR